MLLLGSAAAVLAGCGAPGNDRTLEVLRADPMATLIPPGLIESSRSEEGFRKTFGKPSYAQLRRMFTIADDLRLEEVLAEAVAAAIAAGWSDERPINDQLQTWQGSKADPHRTCAVTVLDRREVLVLLTNYDVD